VSCELKKVVKHWSIQPCKSKNLLLYFERLHATFLFKGDVLKALNHCINVSFIGLRKTSKFFETFFFYFVSIIERFPALYSNFTAFSDLRPGIDSAAELELYKAQLKLALAWNQKDLAETLFLTEYRKVPGDYLIKLLVEAVRTVRLFKNCSFFLFIKCSYEPCPVLGITVQNAFLRFLSWHLSTKFVFASPHYNFISG